MKTLRNALVVLQQRVAVINLLLVTILTVITFSTTSKINNFEKLAYAAKGIPVEYRIFLNFFSILLIVLFYFLIRSGWLYKEFSPKPINKLWAIFLLSFVCFVPTLYLSNDFFELMTFFYKLIGIGHIGRGFADLAGVLQGSILANFPGDYFKIDCPGTCVQYRWQYPSFLLEIPGKSFLAQNVQTVAIILWILLILVSVFTLRSRFFKISYFIFLCLPASLLSHERMNIEILLFFLIPLIVILNSRRYRLLSVPLLIVIMVEIKFYPLVLVALFTALEKFKLKSIGVYLLTGILSIFLVLPDLKMIGSANLVAGYAGSYGLQNFLAILQGAINPYFQLLTPIYVFIGVFLIILGIYYGSTIQLSDTKITRDHQHEKDLFLVAATLSSSAWLANSNYMYRLILLFWCLPYLDALFNRNKQLISVMISLLFFGMSIIPISLTPIRNVSLAVFFSMLIGVLIRVLFNDNLLLFRNVSHGMKKSKIIMFSGKNKI